MGPRLALSGTEARAGPCTHEQLGEHATSYGPESACTRGMVHMRVVHPSQSLASSYPQRQSPPATQEREGRKYRLYVYRHRSSVTGRRQTPCGSSRLNPVVAAAGQTDHRRRPPPTVLLPTPSHPQPFHRRHLSRFPRSSQDKREDPSPSAPPPLSRSPASPPPNSKPLPSPTPHPPSPRSIIDWVHQ